MSGEILLYGIVDAGVQIIPGSSSWIHLSDICMHELCIEAVGDKRSSVEKCDKEVLSIPYSLYKLILRY